MLLSLVYHHQERDYANPNASLHQEKNTAIVVIFIQVVPEFTKFHDMLFTKSLHALCDTTELPFLFYRVPGKALNAGAGSNATFEF